jgi:hypothetical protein
MIRIERYGDVEERRQKRTATKKNSDKKEQQQEDTATRRYSNKKIQYIYQLQVHTVPITRRYLIE